MAALTAVSCASADNTGKFVTPQDLPADVVMLVTSTWEAVADRAPYAAECMSDVELLLVASVDDGDARYIADRIEIEIPTSPARFPESLVHELAHHVDATCSGMTDLRQPFMVAQRIDPNAPWSEASTWEGTPSEQFAEAFVAVVLTSRLLHADTVPIERDAIELVKRWTETGGP